MYKYKELPSGNGFGSSKPLTRILHLEPGQQDDPFHARLEVANAEKTAPYEALSYCWGNEEPNSHVFVDGAALPIRPNLAAAIRALRYPDQVRRIWIDALCIDQSNMAERSRQVRYMRLIYKYCSRVIVWLGPAVPGVEEAFKAAKQIVESEALIKQVSSANVRETNHGGDASNQIQADILYNIQQSLPKSSLQNLCDIFDREYFRRLWVLQEVVAGPRPTAKCGELEMPFLDLASCGAFISYYRHERNTVSRPNAFVWKILVSDRDRAHSKAGNHVEGSIGSLVTLLENLRGFKTSDERDRIYSLLGISDEGLQPMKTLTHSIPGQYLPLLHKPTTTVQNYINTHNALRDFTTPTELRPDYAKDTAKVYTDVTRHLIKKPPGSLIILGHVHHHGDPTPGGFPSWVPNWFEPEIYQSFNTVRYYEAGRWHLRNVPLWRIRPVIWSEAVAHPQRLSLEGFPLGKVQLVTDKIALSDFQRGSPEAVNEITRLWSQLFPFPMVPRPAPAYRSGEPLDEAFCLALSAGRLGVLIHHVAGGPGAGGSMGLLPQPPLLKRQVGEQITRRGIRGFLAVLAAHRGQPLPAPHPLNGWSLEDIDAWYTGAICFATNRRVFVTDTGYLGIGPNIMRPGDEVAVLYRGTTPYVLRRQPDHHLYIGDCYVQDDGIMSGDVASKALEGVGPSLGMYELR